MKKMFLKFRGGGDDDGDDDNNNNDENNNNNDSNKDKMETDEQALAEERRRKRLEKFQINDEELIAAAAAQQQLQQQQQQSQQSQQQQKGNTSPVRTPNTTTTTTTTTTSPLKPVTPTPITTNKPVTPTPITTNKPVAPAPTTKDSIRQCDIPMTESNYYVLEKIFLIYLQPNNNLPEKSIYLPSVNEQIKEEIKDGQLKLDKPVLDRILVERLSTKVQGVPAVEYLISCFNRIQQTIKKKMAIDQQILKDSTELVLLYFGLVLTIPDMFQNTSSSYGIGPVQLMPYLCGETTEELTDEFIFKFLSEYQEDLTPIFEPIFLDLIKILSTTTLTGNVFPYYKVFSRLVQFKAVSDLVVTLQCWNSPNFNGKEMERNTILGSLFSPSSASDDGSTIKQYFSNASTMNKNTIGDAFISIRQIQMNIHNGLVDLLKGFLKVQQENKEAFLSWLASAVEKNLERNKLQVDRTKACSDGFALNLCAVLVLLCEAFVDIDCSKVSMVDTNFLLSGKRHDITKDTRLCATSEEADQWVKDGTIEKPLAHTNFITETFFSTLRALHIGINSTYEKLKLIGRNLQDIENNKRVLLDSKIKWQNTPQGRLFEGQLDLLTKKEDMLKGITYTIDAQLFEPTFLQKTASFLLFATNWILKVINPKNTPLPLPLPAPPQFAALPEFCIEDIVDFFTFVITNFSQVLQYIKLEQLMKFFITILATPEYVKNPYLKAKIIEIISQFVPSKYSKGNPILLECNQDVKDHMVLALMRFYVDIEFTGGHNQFYEKFSYRHYSSLILKYLWSIPDFRKKFTETPKDPIFIKFINMLINDSIYVLDEALAKLAKIKENQTLFDDPNWDKDLTPEQRKEKIEQNDLNERICKSNLSLANSNIDMMLFLSSDKTIISGFMRPELIDRISAMMNYFLALIVGPKCTNLKVREPEKYHFNPKVLLNQLTEIYVNFGRDPRFLQSVVRDGRSFKNSLFQTCEKILQRERLKNDHELDEFSKLVIKLEQVAKEEEQAEEDLGDIPDEFCDPILSTLMTDPVILPSSKTVIDRQTILRHLLSDQTDPFNRSHLTPEMLIDDVETKKKIDEWLASKKKQ
ncbi:U box domain-containing protein [Dictyostelium discoideum AX4]|uniref:Ubiquitin conjugation factor E4 B n=1 Tax=Dictyostelium discoideum TaxID=44689 RepID=O44007_DICDI|nr:U box domain-containing protein [Dictyostelium discoideum AX4]AAC34746.1 NOSA [Dictyostelium discoideum]EAL61256.1 U box domain-containing protein [Dictyostelium discoideum AX4]|eukprot:XP_629703.1 U box domain-containing protein [Dictyostelium discoideum AX4]